MAKRKQATDQAAASLKRKPKGKTVLEMENETSKTSDISGSTKRMGRPPKQRGAVQKYTVVLTPELWKVLNVQGAQLDTDRSGILRALVRKLAAGGIDLDAQDITD